MATTISTQDIIDAKRDIDDIGKAVNEKVIVSPRYGEDFKSLPMIAAEAQSTINGWQDAINTITVNDGVPALAVSDASGVTQQEVNDNQRALFVNILDYGATPFTSDPYAAFNCYAALTAAIDDLVEGGTLYIPAGKFAASGPKIITNKEINIVSDGELYIDASTPTCGFEFKQSFTSVSNANLTDTINKGDKKLKLTSAALPNACDYFVKISSTEPLYAVPLTGGTQYYYKNENIRIINDDFTLMYPTLFNYVDKSKITLKFYKFRNATSKEFKIVLYSVTSATNIPSLIKLTGDSNIDLVWSFKIHEPIRSIAGVGIYCEDCSDIRPKSANSSIFSKSEVGSSYEFLNSSGSNFFFNDINPVQAMSMKHWYTARHDRNIHFNKCNIAADSHWGNDWYFSNSTIPIGITFCGGSLTLNNVKNPSSQYLVSLRYDVPYADGDLKIIDCESDKLLYVPAGSLATYEGFTNTHKPWRSIKISGSAPRIPNDNASIQFWPAATGYAVDTLRRLEINSTASVVPDGYNGSFAPLFNGMVASSSAVIEEVVLNNVTYKIEGTQNFISSNFNMPLRMMNAKKIKLIDCEGLSFAGCKADIVRIKGGEYGVPSNAQLQAALTDIRQLNDTVEVFIDGALMSPLARSYTLPADVGSVNKSLFIDNTRLAAAFVGGFAEASFVRKSTNNYVKSGNTYLNFDIKNYFSDDIRGERYARVSDNIPSLAAGATTATKTASFRNARLNQNEVVVGAFNINSKGLRIVAWVSATDTISYYVENPTGNPNGAVTLGAVDILFKTV